ncbi:response regulator transcription factor [Senegalimassilia sp.]
MARLFIVEDDASLRENLVRMLKLKGHECLCCGSFANAAAEALAACPDCILLDLSLPGAYGHEVCRSIRQGSNVPIIVLTSSDSEFDEVMSMNVGADDYVVKPYRPAALLARIDRALTRSGSADPARGLLEHDGVSLDPVRAEVSYRGESVELSRNELLILRILMESAGSIISRSELMDELWQTDAFVDDNTLTVNVNRLRRSLRSAGVPEDFITTRRGLGYVVR